MNMPVLDPTREIFQNNLKEKTKQDTSPKGDRIGVWLRLGNMVMPSAKNFRE